MKKIIILGASEFNIPIISKAKEMGLYTIVLDINPDASGIKYADKFIQCSIKDVERVLKIARQELPDGITVGITDSAVTTAAIVCDKLGLSCISPSIALVATNKYQMIEAFRNYGVPHPQYKLINSLDQLNEISNFQYPLISKPVDMASSKGINLINSKEELVGCIKQSMSISESGTVLLEEYMKGPEVSVELIVIDGYPTVLQVTDKITTGAPHFIEIGHIQPSSLDLTIITKIKDVACAAAKSVGLMNSIVHAEIIVTRDGPKMVELGARMGGDAIQEQLLELSTGINMPEASIRIALGENIVVPKVSLHKASAIRFIQSSEGIVSLVNGIDDAKKVRFVNQVKLYCKEGDSYEKAKDNTGRMGYVIAQAEEPQEALKACNDAIEAINISFQTKESLRINDIELVAVSTDDYDTYYRFRCDPTDYYWNGYDQGPNYDNMKNLFNQRLWNSEMNEIGGKRIYLVKSYKDDIVDNIGFVMLMKNEDGVEIGITIIKEYQGKGLGSQTIPVAIKLAYRYGDSIYARIRDDNFASQNIFKNNGFVYTEDIQDKLTPILCLKLRKWIYSHSSIMV